MSDKVLQILVVEDNLRDVHLLREMFSQERPDSFELIHVWRMDEAELHLANADVDIVLLDLGLPDEQGLNTVRRARAAAPAVPIIVMTGLDDEVLSAAAMKEGAQDYLVKGQVESRALPRALRYAIDRHHMQMESELFRTLQSQARVNSVLECTSDSVLTMDEDWVIVYGNKKAVESLPGFGIGQEYWSCFPSVLGTPAERHLRTAMSERSETNYEYYYGPCDRWYRVHAFPNEDGLSMFFSNITEERKIRVQLELEQVLREKRIEALSHMAGGLAHEINNPLAIIHAKASNLMTLSVGKEPLSAIEVLKTCESILQISQRAMTILRGLRGFAREAGQDPMRLASIVEIIEQCVEMQQDRFNRSNVEMRLDLQPHIPDFLCRETQIGQILTNLLNNAFDAIVQADSAERWIFIQGGCIGTDIYIDVTDSGPGIEERFKPHLMEPFFTTKTKGLGMGIGLSLSNAIAEGHGGTLTLCTGKKHTCFRLVLPIEPGRENPQAARDLVEVSVEAI